MEILKQVKHVFAKHPHLKTASLPRAAKIVEVSPRDGLQNEKSLVPTATKIALIDRLTACGFKVIEATSFVSPKWVPQLKDGHEVLTNITRKEGVAYPVLTPNLKGLEKAIKAGAEEVCIFGAASETFQQKNINCSIEESIERFTQVATQAREAGLRCRGYISCVMGCPYEGEIDSSVVNYVAQRQLQIDCHEISLGDTIGIGTTEKTQQLLDTVEGERSMLAAHFHNTYGRAVENYVVALAGGVSVLDSSVAGLGGCPYAQGASGNVATEDVVFMCELLGISHGIDAHQMCDVGDYISGELGRENLAKASKRDFEEIENFKRELEKQ